ncbi:MAG: ABC transporter permease [Thermaerobacter sp.]|nr:ABC transporter permease [Thermaerobacter sp.]
MSAQLKLEDSAGAGLANAEKGLSREWRAFWRNPLAVAGVVILAFLVLFSWAGPLFYHVNPKALDLAHIVSPPFAGHILGTDGVGRDQLAQLMWGGQLSLLVGFAAAVAGMAIGVIYGLVSAELGGWVDTVLMRFVDVTLAVPGIYLLLLLDSMLSPNSFTMIFIIAVTSWQGIARIVRGEVLSLRTRDFVEAARAEGASWGRVMFRHYLPNTLGPIIVYTTFSVGGAILTVAGLSFLGLGLPPNDPNWGTSIANAMSYTFQNAWWLIYPPGILIVLAELAVNFLGDAFNAAFDPRLRGSR